MRIDFARVAVVLMAGTAAVAFSPAQAQDSAATAATNDESLDAIVVTARRREEKLIDVPIAVTSISGAQLEQAGALDITDVGATVPNVTLENSRATNSTLTAFIRGIGQQDPVAGFEQGVGIYLDDVYLNRPQAAVLDIYDVERIEVLRGPQGTLYGRNTIGGAVKYVTRQLPQDFEIKARATYGTYDQAEGVVSVAAPISDMVRVGGSVARLSRGGFGDNITTGRENYNKDVWAGRGSIELGGYGAPVFVRVQGDYTRDKSNPRGGYRLIPGLSTGTPVLGDKYDTAGGIDDPKQDVEAYGLMMKAELNLSDEMLVRSISAWRHDKSGGPIDFDATPVIDLDVPGRYINDQISQELQLVYQNDALSALAGFYYLEATADTIFDSRLYTTLPLLLPKLTGHTDAAIDTTTYAAFADVTYDFTDQFSLSVGGRYTWDKRKGDILKTNYILGGSSDFANPGIYISTDTDFSGSRSFNKFTPRASLSFMPTPDHNIYGSYSKGFKGGGYDPRGAGANAPDLNGDTVVSQAEVAEYLSFEPESVDSYELGYKGSLMDRRLTVAVAAFYSDYKDVQIPGSVACVNKGVPTFCGIVSNAAKATIKGFEFEGNARLPAGFNLAASLGYVDAKYKKYIANIASKPTDVSDHRKIQNTPKWTASGTLSWTGDMADGELYLGTTLSYRSKTYQFEIPNPYIDQKGYTLLDAGAVYTAPGKNWSLGVHGKNILNKKYKTSGYTYVVADPVTGNIPLGANGYPIPALGTEGTLTAFYGNPRQVFVTATLKY